jgi:hypothetical protein
VCIIWNGKVSSGVGEYHQEACVSSGRGGYHLERESIIWRGCVSSGREWYNLEQERIIWIGEGVIYLRE